MIYWYTCTNTLSESTYENCNSACLGFKLCLPQAQVQRKSSEDLRCQRAARTGVRALRVLRDRMQLSAILIAIHVFPFILALTAGMCGCRDAKSEKQHSPLLFMLPCSSSWRKKIAGFSGSVFKQVSYWRSLGKPLVMQSTWNRLMMMTSHIMSWGMTCQRER